MLVKRLSSLGKSGTPKLGGVALDLGARGNHGSDCRNRELDFLDAAPSFVVLIRRWDDKMISMMGSML